MYYNMNSLALSIRGFFRNISIIDHQDLGTGEDKISQIKIRKQYLAVLNILYNPNLIKISNNKKERKWVMVF